MKFTNEKKKKKDVGAENITYNGIDATDRRITESFLNALAAYTCPALLCY